MKAEGICFHRIDLCYNGSLAIGLHDGFQEVHPIQGD